MENFKYLTIVEWAKQIIAERGLASGDKFFSEAELCGIHNVSRQTVRQAIAVMENQGVLRRRQGSGTFIHAPEKRRGEQLLTIGLVSTYFSDYIFPSIITGIESVLKKNNATLRLSTTRNHVYEEERALRAMLEQGVDGLIVEPSKSALPSPNVSLYNEILARKIPLVFFNAKYPWSTLPCVAMDDAAAASTAARHLLELGHRKVSGIFLLDDIQGHLRYKGFAETLTRGGIPDAEKRVMWFSSQDRDDLFAIYTDKLLKLLRGSTGIVCYNDGLAVDLVGFCKQHGIQVPGDVSVVGIDDAKPAAACEVPLSTVRHPQQLLGERAAEVLLGMISNPDAPQADVIFTAELVRRKSVAAPGGGAETGL